MEVKKNRDIQIMRGVAITLVIMQHYRGRLPTPNWYASMFDHVQFWPGVDIFFAISGYLICKTFLHDLRSSPSTNHALQNFWTRRFYRLIPASVFWCITSVAVAAVVTTWPGSNPLKVAKSAVLAIIGLSNFFWNICITRNLDCGNPDFNGVTWSLSLEWQLYAIITLLLAILRPRIALAILLAISLGISFFDAPSFSLPWVIRPQAFTLGALIFLIQSGYQGSMHLSPTLAKIVFVIGVAICLTSPTLWYQPIVIPMISLGAALCLLSALHGTSLIFGFSTNILEWLGERSYSVYLSHLLCIHLLREIFVRMHRMEATTANVCIAMAALAISVATSSNFSYRYIELNFNRMKSRPLLKRY